VNLGEEKLAEERPRDALPLFERALRIEESTRDAETRRSAMARLGSGEALLGIGARAAALPLLARALAGLEKHGGDPTDLARARFALARAEPPEQAAAARRLAALAREAYA